MVVKVQRPGLRQLFDIDLKNIRVLAQWLQAADPKSDGAARDWVAIYDECSRILYQVRHPMFVSIGSNFLYLASRALVNPHQWGRVWRLLQCE